MTLKEWAERKQCVCRHPERYACAESLLDHNERHNMDIIAELEPCECPCHEPDPWEDDET